jgi:hypothetical protein
VIIGSSLVPLIHGGRRSDAGGRPCRRKGPPRLHPERQQIPPEIFRDFGDGDSADSASIWVTVDVKAAIGMPMAIG